MSDPIRTFIALPISLPSALKAMVREFQEMGRAVKAVSTESTHITLKFLGDTPSKQLPEIIKILESAAANARAWELELVGVGAFPHWGRPSVVWAGVQPAEPLTTLAQELEAQFEALGFPPEKRAFHPHLTLARIKAKPPAQLMEIAEANEHRSFGHQTIDQVMFYQSDLQPEGPVYTPLHTIALES